MLFSEDKISEIIEKNDIVDVISEYMTLKRSGNNYGALCPFHSEKTPSFSVSSSKQIFNCFGCGVGGNVITFIQKIEKIGFVEAVKLLAERAGVQLEEEKDPKQLEKAKLQKALYKANTEAARFFYSNLNANDKALEYLRRRGLSETIIKRFGLGFAPDKWHEMMDFMKRKGFNTELLYKAGLIVKNKDGEKYYDKFRNRIMFPIIDLKGNVIAFGGRVTDDSKPKYLNSPDTPVFNKGYNIYGLNFVKRVQNLENIIVVEGYMDAIALHQFGVDNAVASLGTAFTENQAKLLKRFSNEIIISYDSDLAGQTATMKGLSILEKQGCVVKVLSLPTGKDPDEYIRKEGIDAFRDRIKKSISLIEYKIENFKRGLDINNIQDRIKFTKGFSEILKDVESNVEVDAYIKKYSKTMQVNETALYAELNRLRDENKNGNNKHNILNINKNDLELKKGEVTAEIYLLNICIYYFKKAENIFVLLEPADFSNAIHVKIAGIIQKSAREKKTITAGEIIGFFENDEEKSKVAEIFSQRLPEADIDSLIKSSVEKVKQSKLDRRIQELIEKMDEIYSAGEIDSANRIFVEIKELQKKKR
ncbi:MAG TPA: DNA primase [Clostridia bacterium]|nr:DNA primase [Clostridia bacterium]